MAYFQIASPDVKYLAATDILIGDMSDINYEFLLYNRPVILLANAWLQENFPDIGIKTDLSGMEYTIKRSINCPEEFEANRMYWLNRTINLPFGNASEKILEIAIQRSGYSEPVIVLLHGDNLVRKTNLIPLYEEGVKKNIKVKLNSIPDEGDSGETIYIAAHFDDLLFDKGFKVHLDHGLKGRGTANLAISMRDYKQNNYFPTIDLHITAGKEGFWRTTSLLLGPNKERAVIGGYPKSDMLLKANTTEKRNEVCRELNFEPAKKIVTYAPAGPLCYEKLGGSLSYKVLRELKRISKSNDFNVLVKLKNKRHNPHLLPLKKIKSFVKRKFGNY